MSKFKNSRLHIIVAHPGKQHSLRTAQALYEAGELEEYITSIYDRKGSWTRRVKRFLSKKNFQKASSRRSNLIPDVLVRQQCEIEALFLVAISKLPGSQRIWRIGNHILANRFGLRVAKLAIKSDANMVIGYDSNCSVMFKYLRKHAPNIIRVLDTTIAVPPFQKKIITKDFQQTGDHEIVKEEADVFNLKTQKRVRTELENSDYFLAGSNFVKKSLVEQNIDPKRVSVVHYGANLSATKVCSKQKNGSGLRLLYVGQVTYRKGLHHLLKVISKFEPDQVKLRIAGQVDKSLPLYQQYKNSENIEFLGFLTHDDLVQAYSTTDLFIMASLVEGFSMAIIEAMASALPVLVTDHTGADDAIVDGVNGFLVPAGDEDALRNKLLEVISMGDQLSIIGKRAKHTASVYTWSNYADNLRSVVEDWYEQKNEVTNG